ncbi:L-glyceraldehyde 3-phosphate reductase [Bacteroidales bacterium]|nr:L-glyceraldehyde 3-phosphate reductase [Bacteroidales bacterium]
MVKYNFCGNSGLQLPQLSLGLWHNFGDVDDFSTAKAMVCKAFELGISHFDLANNYGPSPGSAEINFGKILNSELKNHRDQMIISSKAGHLMWSGPYGDGGSRKYMMASLNQSLKRTGLDYFDIFYSHRHDSQTPIEETVQALIDMVKQGKALYIGLSKYPAAEANFACQMMREQHVPCLIYQDKYNLLHRNIEENHTAFIEEQKVGFIAFSPLAQGLLTAKYLHGIPPNSRAAKAHGFLKSEEITPELLQGIAKLNEMAIQRGQSLSQMALAWVLKNPLVSSVIVGTSSVEQLIDNIDALKVPDFSDEELQKIDLITNF